MNSYHNILDKLKQFTQKFYTKMLIKGVLLFLALGLLFFIVIMAVEYFLWLNSTGRLLLLLVFLGVELFLLYRYIMVPISYLLRLKKGIDNKQASLLIGKHFSLVGDKLYNLLDLAEDKNRSELLIASIEQRSENLKPIPFAKAIDLGENLKYARYLIVPALIFALLWFSGNLSDFFGSYKRVVNYDMAYEPPAPFSFQVLSGNLEVLESESFTVQVTTEGKVKPENIFIVIEGKELMLQQNDGLFEHTLNPPLQSMDFYFKANDVTSRNYRLTALKTPVIKNFRVVLDYPDYTNKPTEVLKSTGNATVPEGTEVTWELTGDNTERVNLVTKDTAIAFLEAEGRYRLSQTVYASLPYQLTTSNKNVKDYEKLDYQFTVIKDAYPRIRVKQVMDSLNPGISYYIGQASDDYRLSSIKLVCFPDENTENKQVVLLQKSSSNFEQFYYTFPSGLRLDEGKNYSFYFQATDNDGIRKGKTVKSQVFNLAVLDDNQLKNKQLEFQQSILDNMDKSLDKFKEQKETLQEINKEQKEKKELNFSDQNQIKDFLKKQQQQENLMQKFSKQLKENLDKGNKNDELNNLLQERLERREIEAKKNAELLEELNRIADKINKEELAKRLEELGKNQQNSQRSLEQLLELTKRYYVTEKTSQLAKDLQKLADRQEILSELRLGEDFSGDEQKKLNEKFEDIEKELDELNRDNQSLKKPLDLKIDEKKKKGIKDDQMDALKEINKHQGEEQSLSNEQMEKMAKKAKEKQKSAAQKIQEMSDDLQESSSASGGSSITEDADMLRQILDNLVTFSFKQEKLYDNMQKSDADISQFSNNVRKQQQLKELFEHVDDSLFALSLRRAELSEFVNEQITEVYYNIDKSLESIAENQVYQSASYQQYALTASNSLADFLAKLLDNMQQSMKPGAGSGQGQDFQLPDIIKSQGELQEKMGQMGQSGKQGAEGKSGKGEEGEGKDGGKGKDGKAKDKEGKGGEEGNQGEEGQSGNDGENSSNKQGSQDGGQGQGGPSEQELKEIYEIYKEQQLLRQQLEQQLQDMINSSDKELAKKLIRQMEDFENDLLENGVTRRTLSKINTIQHELMKLENATLKQGKKAERKSNTNLDRFQNPIITKPAGLENNTNEIEILNRQALPLRQIFQNKVKVYFGKDD